MVEAYCVGRVLAVMSEAVKEAVARANKEKRSGPRQIQFVPAGTQKNFPSRSV